MSSLNKPVKTRTFIIVLVAFLVVIMAAGFITAGFTVWKPDDIADNLSRKPNPDNLYTAECVAIESAKLDNGVTLEVDEDTGAITLDGEATSSKDVVIGSILLDAGEYNLTAIDSASKSVVYVSATINGVVYCFDFTENDGNIVTVEADDTPVTLTLHIVEGAEFNKTKVRPVIVSGTEAGEFYA